MPDTDPSLYLCCSAPKLEVHKNIIPNRNVIYIQICVCVCILRQAQKRVSLQAVMGSGGSWGLWWQQLEMRKMVLGERENKAARSPRRSCSLGREELQEGHGWTSDLPSDAALLMFLMPRTAENWGSWLKKSQVVSWQCPGGCWDRAGLAHAKCRWPVTPGWSHLHPHQQTPNLRKSLKQIEPPANDKMYKLNLGKTNALRAVCLIPQALFTDGFI